MGRKPLLLPASTAPPVLPSIPLAISLSRSTALALAPGLFTNTRRLAARPLPLAASKTPKVLRSIRVASSTRRTPALQISTDIPPAERAPFSLRKFPTPGRWPSIPPAPCLFQTAPSLSRRSLPQGQGRILPIQVAHTNLHSNRRSASPSTSRRG